MARVDEAARHRLYTELTEQLDEADTLMQLLPTSRWEDLVTKDHLDARFAHVETRFAQVDAKIERSTRHVIVWGIGALFASNGMMLAILNATR